MRILVFGMNHRTAPVEVRERFAADPEAAVPRLVKLVGDDEIDEAVLVSTCNRIEIVATTRRPEAARLRLARFLAHELGEGVLSGLDPEQHCYLYSDARAVQHLFRVAASVDSLVVGEPQILGQLKEAYRASAENGCCGMILNRLFSRAFGTAKRVRRETGIAERPVSVARVAVELARQIFEELGDKTALLIGAGEMIEAAASALQDAGLARMRVANRTLARAEGLAQRFEASAHPLADVGSLLEGSDLVLSCIAADGPVLDKAAFSRALRVRRHRPVFVIDIGVPRNVASDVHHLDDVYLFDLDDLSGVAERNADERRRETLRAEAIVLEEQQRFEGWLTALRAVPTIRDLRAWAERIRDEELERQVGRLDLSPEQRDGVEQLARGLVNKLLHAPISRLRRHAEQEEGVAALEAARGLFGLDDGSEALLLDSDDDETNPSR